MVDVLVFLFLGQVLERQIWKIEKLLLFYEF
jgi:hypothetical protein